MKILAEQAAKAAKMEVQKAEIAVGAFAASARTLRRSHEPTPRAYAGAPSGFLRLQN